ncbi:hypothetical protein DUI87_26673 [Hirundo rustica rustica]|uniref:Uncharacterized protein n=1 Tax=Hirundo rustica rustica TaxID=333673 RepID=A0A3M0J6V5_HIRRU|nr:hypothetical protein DUI87_26673 [Hirundo rustica rustica]
MKPFSWTYFSGVDELPNAHGSDVTWRIRAGDNAKEGEKLGLNGEKFQKVQRCQLEIYYGTSFEAKFTSV